jgi:hypothetical protein
MLIVKISTDVENPAFVAAPARLKRKGNTKGIRLDGISGRGASKDEAVADLARQLVLVGAIEYREAKKRTRKVVVAAEETVTVQDSLEIIQTPANPA